MIQRLLLLVHLLLFTTTLQLYASDVPLLVNINFTAHLNPAFSIKTGVAVVGHGSNDYWNVYSRDLDSPFNGRSGGTISNLLTAEKQPTSINLSINNAFGTWYSLAADPMMNSYLYPSGGGDITVQLTNIPLGTYDLYVYAHGQLDRENEIVDLKIINDFVGESSTSSGPNWNTGIWQEGRQFILFKSLHLNPTLPVNLTIKGGVSGLAAINGLQLISADSLIPDTLPPVIQIMSPISSTNLPIVQLSGSIIDNIGVTKATWSFNGGDPLTLPLNTDGRFNIGNIPLNIGANVFEITALDANNNLANSRVVVTNTPVIPGDTNIIDSSHVLVNVDFTAHLNPAFTVKTGIAAVGHASTDYWNVYSRDIDSPFNGRSGGTVQNLLTAEGQSTGMNLSVSNAFGTWYSLAADPMLNSYLYPSGGGPIVVQLTNVPPGTYDLYIYAHGQLNTENAIIDVSANGVPFAERMTSSEPNWNAPIWQNGKQFVIFRSLTTISNSTIDLSIRGGVSRLAIINGLQLISPAATNVDMHPPVVTITSPPAGNTNVKTIDLAGAAIDDVTVVGITWSLNNGVVNSLALTNGAFMLPTIVLSSGTNIIRVIAIDAEGNQGTNSVEVVYTPPIFLKIGSATVQEGADVTVPIFLDSSGSISGFSFSINYDPKLLADPQIIWSLNLANALVGLNTNFSSQLRASFALPGQILPAGNNVLANLTFRTKSVAADRSSTLTPSLSGFFDSSGSVIISDSGTHVGTVQITRRRFLGDNNGNNRLDVGDASALMRFVTGFDPIQNWDISGNDLNSNGSIDSGDVIKVLRAVVGLDPQPQGTNGALSRLRAQKPISAGTFNLTANETVIKPGDIVNVRVELANNESALTGASFRLAYPANALRLIDAQSLQSGAIVPNSSAVLWNVSPEQNDFAAQDGMVSVGISSALPWVSTNGVIAEFAFQVQAEASAELIWPVSISNGEISTGFQVQPVSNAQILLQGRAAIPLAFVKMDGTSVQLRVEGEVGKTYEVDYSSDLETWTPVTDGAVTLLNGMASISDSNISGARYRFYRVIEVAP